MTTSDIINRATNRSIFKAAAIVGLITIVVKLASMAKDLVIANQFGTGDALDAFLIAFLVPSFVINVVAGSFNAALIPTYIQVREHEGQETAQKLFSNIMVLSITLLVGIALLLALFGNLILPFIGSGFNAEKIALTHSLFLYLLPVIVFSGLSTIWGAVLNAHEHFALAAFSPLMVPVITVLVLLAAGKTLGIYALALGTLGGFVFETILLMRGLKRQRLFLVPRWFGLDFATKQVWKQYIPMVAGAFLMSSTTVVDQAMAAMLDPGSVSLLNYGNKVVSFILGIGSIALGTAVLPYFSKAVSSGDLKDLWRIFNTYVFLILLITIPITLILIYLSEPIISLLFERGAFVTKDVKVASQIQALYLIQVPFYILGILITRLISSIKFNYLLMWGAAINLVLNLLLNYILMYRIGVAGIALSTSIVYLISCCYLFFMLLKAMKKQYSTF